MKANAMSQDLTQVLRQKELELTELQREIQVLRNAVRVLQDFDSSKEETSMAAVSELLNSLANRDRREFP